MASRSVGASGADAAVCGGVPPTSSKGRHLLRGSVGSHLAVLEQEEPVLGGGEFSGLPKPEDHTDFAAEMPSGLVFESQRATAVRGAGVETCHREAKHQELPCISDPEPDLGRNGEALSQQKKKKHVKLTWASEAKHRSEQRAPALGVKKTSVQQQRRLAEQQVTFQKACDTARYLVQCRLILHDAVSQDNTGIWREAPSACDTLRRQLRSLSGDYEPREGGEPDFSGNTRHDEVSFLLRSAVAFLKPEELSDVALERQSLGRCGFFLCSEASANRQKPSLFVARQWRLDPTALRDRDSDNPLLFCSKGCYQQQKQLERLQTEQQLYRRPQVRSWLAEVALRCVRDCWQDVANREPGTLSVGAPQGDTVRGFIEKTKLLFQGRSADGKAFSGDGVLLASSAPGVQADDCALPRRRMNVASFSAAEKTASHAVPNCETTSHERAGSSTRMKKNEQGSRSRVIPVKLEEEATTSDDGERYQETIEDKQEVPCGGKNFKEENSVSQQQRQGLGKTYKSHLAKSSSSSRRPVSGVHERGVASTQKPSRFHLPHLPAAVDQVLLLDYSQGETEPPTESRNASQERQTEDAGQNTDGKESALVATGGSRAGKTDQDVHKENAAICEDRNDLCRTVCLHNQVDTRSRGAILSQCGGGSLGNFEGAAELQGGRPRSTEGHGSVAETGFRQSVPDAPGNGKNCRLLEADAGVKSDSEEQAACEPPARPIAIVDLEKKSEEGLAKDISEFLDFSDDEPTDFPDTHLQNKDLGNGNQKGRARHLIPGPPTTTDASQNARYSLGVPGAAPSSVGLEVQRAYMRLSDLAIVWDLLGSWSRAETRDVLLWIRSGRVKRRTDNTEESVSAAFPGQAQCLDGKLADNRSAEAAAAGAVELQQQRSEQLAQALLRALPSSLLEHCGRDVADVCRTFRIKRALPPLPPSLCRTFLAVVFLALHGLRRSSTSSASSTRVSCGGATMAMSEDPGCVDTVGVRDWVNRADKDDGDIECGVRLFIRGAISDAASRCSRVQRGDTRGDASSHRCTVGPRPTLGSAQEDKTAEVSLLHPPGAMPAPEQRMATGVGPAIGFSVVSAVRECDIQAEQEGRLGTRGSRFDTNSSVATDGDGETVAWWWAGKCLAILFGPLVDA